MRYLILVVALFLIACRGPYGPSEFSQFAEGDTFPQLSNLPLGGDDWEWRHPHAHSTAFICWICVQTFGQRDHNGDGIMDDFLRDFPQESVNVPQPTVPVEDLFGPYWGGGEWMHGR